MLMMVLPSYPLPPLQRAKRHRRLRLFLFCSFRSLSDNHVAVTYLLQVFSRTEIDIFPKFVVGGAPSPWRAEPGPLKVVAIDTGAGVVQLNSEEGGVVVAIVR